MLRRQTHPLALRFLLHALLWLGSALIATAAIDLPPPPPATLVFEQPLHVGSYVETSVQAEGPATAGAVYRATGLPAGLRLEADGTLIGGVRGRPGTYHIRYWQQVGRRVSEIRELQVEVGPFPAHYAGTYEVPLENYPALDGKLAFTIAKSGVVTGKLTLTRLARPFVFRRHFVFHPDMPGFSAEFSPGKGLPSTDMWMSLDPDDETIAHAGVGGSPSVHGIGGRIKTFARGESAAAAGRYTLALGAPIDPAPSAYVPEGAGYATAAIARGGGLKIVGRLPDNSPFTGHHRQTAAGTYDVFSKPRAQAGHGFGGFLSLEEIEDMPGRFAATGDFVWSRPATAGKVYPGGFEPQRFTARLRPWRAPSSRGPTLPELLGIEPGDAIPVTFTGLNSEPENLPTAVVLTLPAKFTVPDAEPSSAFRIKLAPSTGLFSGSFVVADHDGRDRGVTFRGVLLQRLPTDEDVPLGAGFFLAPSIPYPGWRESGLIQLD